MKHLLGTRDLSREDAIRILDTTAQMSATQEREIRKLPTLRGRTVVNLFFEDSTRTRISFEAAAKRLSADVINFSAKGSSLSKGESLKDTALTLQAMGADAVVIRHWASGAAQRLADSGWMHGAVLNAGDGTHEHPTQALLDAFTARRHLVSDSEGKGLDGLTVAIVGDILHSRVAGSNVALLKTLGANVVVVAPPTLLPFGMAQREDISVYYTLDDALEAHDLDAIMMLRVQRERMTGGGSGFFPSPEEYTRLFGLDRARMDRMPDHAIIMHPGPMNRGLEISAEAADSPRSVIVEQVSNGVAVRMAALYLLLSGEEAPQ
ncbi:aspartate carbamoyltransferase catalytic subunit [Demequina sp. B12]|uniref:aspartate carbamoyltransferase catalytic subunit n=1 Tax=Demequina sp. B12 TaxID=2992757 RepID=UPI00237C06CE|nr:aspartate carbamoyltransferase catalytic subunit [Demequina sp. B12]MDE0573055.1 aspartate carbamoyltransferase catalytic subunit [Demequina sp. B12]